MQSTNENQTRNNINNRNNEDDNIFYSQNTYNPNMNANTDNINNDANPNQLQSQPSQSFSTEARRSSDDVPVRGIQHLIDIEDANYSFTSRRNVNDLFKDPTFWTRIINQSPLSCKFSTTNTIAYGYSNSSIKHQKKFHSRNELTISTS